MQISNNTAVTIHYTLTSDTGEEIDSTRGSEPMVYLHGNNNIIGGLEKALHSKNAGDKVNVRVEPSDAYGEYNDQMVQVISRAMFDGIDQLSVGMQFHAAVNSDSGVVTITKIDGDEITIDSNHPLAGQALNFDVEIVNVRLATKDEISHSHVHVAGCSH